MSHPLKDIDPDGVLPKKKDITPTNYQSHIDRVYTDYKETERGYNQSCSDHQEIGVEINVEEIIYTMLRKRYGHQKQKYSLDAVKDAKEYAQAIVNNPKILKLVNLSSRQEKGNENECR